MNQTNTYAFHIKFDECPSVCMTQIILENCMSASLMNWKYNLYSLFLTDCNLVTHWGTYVNSAYVSSYNTYRYEHTKCMHILSFVRVSGQKNSYIVFKNALNIQTEGSNKWVGQDNAYTLESDFYMVVWPRSTHTLTYQMYYLTSVRLSVRLKYSWNSVRRPLGLD